MLPRPAWLALGVAGAAAAASYLPSGGSTAAAVSAAAASAVALGVIGVAARARGAWRGGACGRERRVAARQRRVAARGGARRPRAAAAAAWRRRPGGARRGPRGRLRRGCARRRVRGGAAGTRSGARRRSRAAGAAPGRHRPVASTRRSVAHLQGPADRDDPDERRRGGRVRRGGRSCGLRARRRHGPIHAQAASTPPLAASPPIRCSALMPAAPRLIAGDTVGWTGRVRPLGTSDYDAYLAGLGITATLRGHGLHGAVSRRLPGRPPGGVPSSFRRRVAAPSSGAGGRAGGGDSHRPPGPRGPRRGCRVHHCRSQPHRGDLGLEHRDRRRHRDGPPARLSHPAQDERW